MRVKLCKFVTRVIITLFLLHYKAIKKIKNNVHRYDNMKINLNKYITKINALQKKIYIYIYAVCKARVRFIFYTFSMIGNVLFHYIRLQCALCHAPRVII
jgi:hypothetical protein